MHGFVRRGHRDERGAIAVFSALVLTVMLGFTAILVDLGQMRSSARTEQAIADYAALAAGKALSENDPNTACRDAINYLNQNDKRITTAINASTACASITNSCANSTASRTATGTGNGTTVTVYNPVPNSVIQTSVATNAPYWIGAGKNDGQACSRMRVVVTHNDTGLFAGIFGVTKEDTTRSATVVPPPPGGSPPVLWLLDPHGCSTPLKVDGGSQVTVGTDTVQGVITIDSDGTDSKCTTSNTTVNVSGSGTFVKAIGPPGPSTTTGGINIVALPDGVSSCTNTVACSPSNVSSGQLLPQPQHGTAATRSYIDWKYNCLDDYTTSLHPSTTFSSPMQPCPYTVGRGGTNYAYVDNLETAIGASGMPSNAWTEIKDQGNNKPCSTGNFEYPPGNYFVNCPKGNNGYVLNGRTVTFDGGNVVFGDNVTVSNNGVLNINTGTGTPGPKVGPVSLSSSCLNPSDFTTTGCSTQYSQTAAYVYFRGDSTTQFSTSGGGVVNLKHVFVYGGTGAVAFSGAPPTWTAPTEGPFTNLAYWTDMPKTASSNYLSSFVITGGSGASLTGVFFTPEAQPFKLAGGGNWGQQKAQFISYDFTVTGGGVLRMAPDPSYPTPAAEKGYLIR
jgi:Flp pilus assembly protein TadG